MGLYMLSGILLACGYCIYVAYCIMQTVRKGFSHNIFEDNINLKKRNKKLKLSSQAVNSQSGVTHYKSTAFSF